MLLTASSLRHNMRKILDGVIEAGESVEIERNGRILRIVADLPGKKRLRIKKRPGLINGDPRDLAQLDSSKQ
jgi:hypothetical protein